MPLKKQTFTADEIEIYDEAVVYKRGEYWQMRMWLGKEKKYARFSLRTRNRDTAIDKAKKYYHELMAQQLAGKTYFSKTTKQGVEEYLKQRALDVEAELIVRSGRVCLNNFPRFISGFRVGWQRCRVVHGGVRRLRRTQSRGGQLGAHQDIHLTRPILTAVMRPGTSLAASAARCWNVAEACCTSSGNRRYRLWPHSPRRRPSGTPVRT